MITTLSAIGLLTALSIVGAFLGVDGARAMFNSAPLVIGWFALLGLLLVGFVYFAKLLRSPGALAVHAGSVLVLCGAMAGSERGHAVAARLFGAAPVPSAFMRIDEGEASDSLLDEEGRQVGTLPFKIRLEDFWIERYRDEGPWRLGIDAPARDEDHPRRTSEIRWAVGEEVAVPFVGARLEVLRYIPSARPAFARGAAPSLEVVEADGKRSVLQARVGQELAVEHPAGRLEVVKVYSHLMVREGEVIDVPGSTANPAVKVLFVGADGQRRNRYAFAAVRMSGHDEESDGLQLNYAMPAETGAVADAASGLPAMEVRLRGRGGAEMREWIVARDADRPGVLSLAPILGIPGGDHHAPGNAFLLLVGRSGEVSDYKSRLTVIDGDGNALLGQVIEVNAPLHFGGYHFYQHSYDNERESYTVLSVRSDAGLTLVYLGFALLCMGVAWLFWVRPARAYLKGGAKDGD
jgi:hypothetical protein